MSRYVTSIFHSYYHSSHSCTLSIVVAAIFHPQQAVFIVVKIKLSSIQFWKLSNSKKEAQAYKMLRKLTKNKV
ncbi:CLUMA_CG010888, isoform A [Clunio marinus]|uniref:CLUMA_CG010888, isoform A n=1 Tax=Clunio marinus TaxID=568069 RepID=A0A1J1IBB0_9DIPT|nr:CLUMA_CG010888, isoform A [Clunio marinus]